MGTKTWWRRHLTLDPLSKRKVPWSWQILPRPWFSQCSNHLERAGRLWLDLRRAIQMSGRPYDAIVPICESGAASSWPGSDSWPRAVQETPPRRTGQHINGTLKPFRCRPAAYQLRRLWPRGTYRKRGLDRWWGDQFVDQRQLDNQQCYVVHKYFGSCSRSLFRPTAFRSSRHRSW